MERCLIPDNGVTVLVLVGLIIVILFVDEKLGRGSKLNPEKSGSILEMLLRKLGTSSDKPKEKK